MGEERRPHASPGGAASAASQGGEGHGGERADVASPQSGEEGASQDRAHPDTPPHPGGSRRLDPWGGAQGQALSPQNGEREAWLHLAGSIEGGTHVLPARVYYEDTDFSGIVYHANYLRFLERGRTDFLRLAGISQSTLHAHGEGLILAVRRMTLDFLKPARMDDVLVVETRAAEVRGASFSLDQRIRRGEELILTADVRVAAIAGGRPARIPDALRAILEKGADGLLTGR